MSQKIWLVLERSLKVYFTENHMAGLTNNEAPGSVGSVKGLRTLYRKDRNFSQFLSYLSNVHQEALWGKFLNVSDILKWVAKNMKKVRAQALQK